MHDRYVSKHVLAMGSWPAVSIIMPIYNAARFLPEAIASVQAQDVPLAWELLLVDDGSTDNSLSIAQRYASCLPDRIRILQHQNGGNRGTSAARNLALHYARAPITAFLDADDVWLPGMLRVQLALLSRHPEAALVYANAERTWDMSLPCDPAQGPLGPNHLPPLLPPLAHSGLRSGLLEPPQALAWFLADETTVPCTCTVLVRTSVARAVGGFVEAFEGLYDDQAFYAKVMLDYPVAVNRDCVARYRWHRDSCCGQAWHNLERRTTARARFHRWLADYQARKRAVPSALQQGKACLPST